MGSTLWREIRDLIETMDWPTSQSADGDSRRMYESGLDLVDAYAGDPSVLVEALERFQQCRSIAYANAGIASVLMAGAYLRGDSYDTAGLQEAEGFLRRAQQTASHCAEIDFLDARLSLLRQQDGKARSLLDNLLKSAPSDYYVLSTEIWYWYNLRDVQNAEHWYQRLRGSANTRPRQIRAAQQVAGCYLACNDDRRALAAYRELSQIEPENAWTWHNMSLIQLKLGDVDGAASSNAYALDIGDFPAAREVQQQISVAKGGTGNWFRRLFGSN